jgi:hypothetical protein
MKSTKNILKAYRQGELAGRTKQPCVPSKKKGYIKNAYMNGFNDGKQNKKDGVKFDL